MPTKHPLSANKLAERDVTAQVKSFLEIRGWRAIRHQRTVIPGAFQTGEPGIPDFCMIHYLGTIKGKPAGCSLVLWVEVKRFGVRQSCKCTGRRVCTFHAQMHWRASEEQRGAIVVQVSSLAVFEPWYAERFGWLHRPGGVGQFGLFDQGAAHV